MKEFSTQIIVSEVTAAIEATVQVSSSELVIEILGREVASSMPGTEDDQDA